MHAVTEQTSDSDSYEDVNCITEVNREDETVNQVKDSHSQGQQLFAGMKIGEKLVNFQIDFQTVGPPVISSPSIY